MADKIAPEYIQELDRYKKLSKFRQYYESKQYEGRADFFTGRKGKSGEAPVPLRERKPCIVYPLPRAAANQVVRFTFGETRFPTVKIAPIDADTSVAGEKLSEDQAKDLETYVANVVDRCGIKPAMRRLMRPGLATGSICAIVKLKDGLFNVQAANAEDVLARFRDDDPTSDILSLTWAYQYEANVPDPKTGRPERKRFWYRLDVDDKDFVEYQPFELRPGEPVKWVEKSRKAHGFSFCPALWMRNVEDEEHGDIDGQSLFEGLLDEFDALNFALSQRHRGINFWGTPQPWETGVEDDDGPQADGRQSNGYSPAGESPHGTSQQAPAQKISPDQIRTYRSDKAAFGLAETTGKSFEAATMHVNDVRGRCLEAMSVVLVNVSEIMGRTHQGQMSAKFLELAYEPLLALVDEMRHCWWPSGLRALLSMMLRMTAELEGKRIYIPGATKAAAILKGFTVDTDTGPIWLPPPMTPAWGDYFSPDNEEIAKAIESAAAAQGLVPDDDRARYVLHYFDRDDVTDALEELEEERHEAEEAKQAAAEREIAALHAAAGGKDPNAPKPGGKPGGGPQKKGADGGRAGDPAPTSPSGGE
jgi:hypothetical protein